MAVAVLSGHRLGVRKFSSFSGVEWLEAYIKSLVFHYMHTGSCGALADDLVKGL
jgi:hypothetical protein